MKFFLSKPRGEIEVYQNEKLLDARVNLFTKYGLRQTYRSGKNHILDVSNGGIFKYFHVGNGDTTITADSEGLSDFLVSAARQNSTLTYRTDSLTNTRYAVFTTQWLLPVGIEGFTEFGMFDSDDPEMGMLCGKSTNSPIELDPLLPTMIKYMVQIPIISSIKVLDSGIMDIDGTSYPYTLEGSFHVEEPTRLSTTFPVETPMITSGNLSRLYANSNILPNGQSKYRCDIITEENGVVYDIHAAVVNYPPSLLLSNVSMGNSDPTTTTLSNFPIRLVFQTSPIKPEELDMNFFVKLIVEVEN